MNGRHILSLLTIVLAMAAHGCQSLTVGNNLGVSHDEMVAMPLPSSPAPVHGEGVLSEPPAMQPPAELAKVSLPAYRIEPPDILLINAVRMAPKPPYEIETLDLLQIVVVGTLPDQPISGAFQVEPNGTVNLGPAYGSVKVAGLPLTEAALAIKQHLQGELEDPKPTVSLLQSAGQQQVAGEHLVGPDGTVNLGIYGSVYVAGMTLAEARHEIETHLSHYLEKPKISLDVLAYNSKVFYIITEGAGFGDQVVRVPVTGNETVLDAIAQIGGLTRASNKKQIWIARPAPSGIGCDQVLVVNWEGITKGGNTATNYQLLPGDRLFIAEDRLVKADSVVSKVTSPLERIFGFTLLGAQTIQVLQRFPGGLTNSGF